MPPRKKNSELLLSVKKSCCNALSTQGSSYIVYMVRRKIILAVKGKLKGGGRKWRWEDMLGGYCNSSFHINEGLNLSVGDRNIEEEMTSRHVSKAKLLRFGSN